MMHVLIIGSGLAGYITAKEIGAANPDVSIDMICQDQGDFYSKPLLSTSLHQNKQPDDLITHTAREMAERYQMTIHAQEKVESIIPEKQRVKTNRAEHRYDRLVLATGAIPRTINDQWETIQGVSHINHLDDYRTFRHRLKQKQSVTIIGSGLVGVEYANDLLLSQHSVNMISLLPYPLYGLVPEAIGLAMLDNLMSKSLNWIQTAGVSDIQSKHAICVTTQENQTIQSDQVLLATGFIPNTTLAKSAQLNCDQGILTNQFSQTNHPNIFAVGDCAQSPNGIEFYISAIRKSAYAIARNLNTVNTPIQSKLTPIVIKSPLYPVVVCFKNNQRVGTWEVDGDDSNFTGRLFDQSGQRIGFALSGDHTTERQTLITWLDG
ncbi:MAG: hypothetical protein CMF46_02200 [Legionellales bacterium]|nr:hypothetical protein [Legionellales bacterium]